MKSMTIEINKIEGLENIKNDKYNDAQKAVIASVSRNGQKVPILVAEVEDVEGIKKYILLDGFCRVVGCLERGDNTMEATIVDTNLQQNSKDVYIINDARIEPSAVKRAELFSNATNEVSDKELDVACSDMNVKVSDDEGKPTVSAPHRSKLLSIAKLPEKIKKKLDFNRLSLNTCHALAKGFNDEILKEEHLNVLINEIEKLSERKSIQRIKAFIKMLDGGSEKEEDVSLKDQKVEAVKFRKTTITIDITKHFQDDKYTINDLTDEHKKAIRELIDKVFEYLKSNHYHNYEERESSSPKQNILWVNNSIEEGEAA
jgi:hypothetical protein